MSAMQHDGTVTIPAALAWRLREHALNLHIETGDATAAADGHEMLEWHLEAIMRGEARHRGGDVMSARLCHCGQPADVYAGGPTAGDWAAWYCLQHIPAGFTVWDYAAAR